jgi:hypothetical protein
VVVKMMVMVMMLVMSNDGDGDGDMVVMMTISQFHKAKKLASQDSALKIIDHLNRV